MLPMRHVEDALMATVLLINQESATSSSDEELSDYITPRPPSRQSSLTLLKSVLGFTDLHGKVAENPEQTLVNQWMIILKWRKGRTLVQRAVLALAMAGEMALATITLKFICRCLSHLIIAENLERQHLPQK